MLREDVACASFVKVNASHSRYFDAADDLLELHRGQGKDIYWRDCNQCPAEEEYLEMVEQSMCSYEHGCVYRCLCQSADSLFLLPSATRIN